MDESLQEKAALHALDALKPEEAAAFERAMAADPELARFTAELREAVASLAHTAPPAAPPVRLRTAILDSIAAPVPFTPSPVTASRPSAATWLQWTGIAALLLLSLWLWADRRRLLQANEDLRAADTLAQIQLRILTAAPDHPTPANAALLWNAARQEGRVETRRLPAPEAGQSYQLWVIDAAHADQPINAGVVPINDRGAGELRFHPASPSAHPAAFAISLEPSVEPVAAPHGPILLVGQ